MNVALFIPNQLRSAGRELRLALKTPLTELNHNAFVRAWCSVAYLFPKLHPDEYADSESNWPRVLKPFAAEAWRRAEVGELTDEQLYPCDAQWCGLYDRMFPHEPHEIQRRLALAADYGESLDA